MIAKGFEFRVGNKTFGNIEAALREHALNGERIRLSLCVACPEMGVEMSLPMDCPASLKTLDNLLHVYGERMGVAA